MKSMPLSQVSPEDNSPYPYEYDRLDEDAISTLPIATPYPSYQAYCPPQTQEYTLTSKTSSPPIFRYKQLSETYNLECTPSASANQRPTTYTEAPLHLPNPPIPSPMSRPDVFPSRTPSSPESPVPSLGCRAQLFSSERRENYMEVLPWAESTNFNRQPPNLDPEPAYQKSLGEGANLHEKKYHRNPRHIRRTWRSGGTKRFPWKGTLALSITCLLIGASITLLCASHRTYPSTYPASIQPPTYLSILDTLASLLALSALWQGICVHFWTRLLRGTTIGDLHDIYSCASPWKALRLLARFQWSRVGLATLMFVLSLARATLFQRALVLKDDRYHLCVGFVVLGAVVSFLAVGAVVPLYFGYWDLGRNVSLDPLEIARAFGSPVFDDVDGNVTVRDIEMETGSLMVRYGVVELNGKEKLLRVEAMERCTIRKPREGEVFG